MSDVMRAHFARMARYNTWANGRLYDAVAALPQNAPWAPRKAFFGSIMGTLNHLLVGDRLWLERMTGTDFSWFTGLDQILHDDLAALRRDRDALDRGFERAMAEVPLSGPFSYKDSRGTPQTKDWGLVLTHVFNHQTHHRGQVHDMLSQCGVTPPVLDLLYFPDEPPGNRMS